MDDACIVSFRNHGKIFLWNLFILVTLELDEFTDFNEFVALYSGGVKDKSIFASQCVELFSQKHALLLERNVIRATFFLICAHQDLPLRKVLDKTSCR